MQLTAIKLERLKAGRLQIEVAVAADIARPRLSEIENGHVDPRPDEVRRLARVLGVPVGRIYVEGVGAQTVRAARRREGAGG